MYCRPTLWHHRTFLLSCAVSVLLRSGCHVCNLTLPVESHGTYTSRGAVCVRVGRQQRRFMSFKDRFFSLFVLYCGLHNEQIFCAFTVIRPSSLWVTFLDVRLFSHCGVYVWVTGPYLPILAFICRLLKQILVHLIIVTECFDWKGNKSFVPMQRSASYLSLSAPLLSPPALKSLLSQSVRPFIKGQGFFFSLPCVLPRGKIKRE